ncbi:MAG: 4-phosphoerythronate dehydrogenase [Halieaceae bacterium]
MKIVADQNLTGVAEIFGGLGELELVDGRSLCAEQLAGVDVLLLRSVTRVDAGLLALHNPDFVGTATSGIDHIDRPELERRNIGFAYAPGSNADSVVDYVLSAIANTDNMLERLLAGERCGIIGYGYIGRRLDERLRALGIECCAYDPWLESTATPTLCSLEQVLECPVLSLHAELTRRQPWPSHHMLEASHLQQMPENSLLINAGRGELIGTAELLQLDAARPDMSLVLDVWEQEPRPDPGLLARARFGTAHIAGYSYDGKLRATRMLYQSLAQLRRFDPVDPGPVLAPLEVEVPPQLESASLLRWLLLQVYDIHEDDAALRQQLEGPGDFDPLRKHYRQRRELGALSISNLQALSASAQSLCNALIKVV